MASFPLQICEVVNDNIAAPVISFFGTCVVSLQLCLARYWRKVFKSILQVVVVNRVATDLEEPFMDEANDIPLADLHVDFNEKITKLIKVSKHIIWLAIKGLGVMSVRI